MKKYRITALITAAAMTLPLWSCTLRSKKKDESSAKEESIQDTTSVHTQKKSKGNTASSDLTPDGQEIHDHVEKLLDDLKISDNEDEVQDDINVLLDDLDAAYDVTSRLMIDYYFDWNNEDAEAPYDEANETLTIAAESIELAFYKGYANKEYSHLFAEYVDKEDDDLIDYYTASSMSLKRAEGYAKVDFELSDEDLDAYYEIAYNDDLSDEEKNIRCAELYLDILSMYDTDSFYKRFNRDYAPEDVPELADYVREYLIPVYDDIWDDMYSIKGVLKLYTATSDYEDPFEVIAEYAPLLSDEIGEHAQEAIDDKLYTLAAGDDCYDGSFTTDLPLEKRSLMYIYYEGRLIDLETAIHEFGHFNSSYYDYVPKVKCVNNLDIAEVQSQGMEIIFLQFYDDIFGDKAKLMKMNKASDMLYAVITGFLVGEFEYTVLKNRDTLTPEEVVECFDEIVGDFMPSWELYYIPHLFEEPGYYISYGTSALAALDLIGDCLDAPELAVERYKKLAKVSSYERENMFRSVLEDCGFGDPLTEDYISYIADAVSDYSDNVMNS